MRGLYIKFLRIILVYIFVGDGNCRYRAVRLVDCRFSELRVGFDGESAMQKAVEFAFTGASLVSCTRHLAENMRRNAHKVTAANDRHIGNLVEAVFGASGLIACADTLSYYTTLHRIRETLLPPVPPKLRQYFDGDIEPQLRNNMEVSCTGWTNNACESMNHVLKQQMQWRLQHLPKLIDKCRALVDAQYNEADRALLGLSDYHLQPAYARHRQTLSRWQTMSEWQRQHVVSDCFQLQLPTAK